MQAVKLADRYITDRFLPDKAIDVIDEAGARARLSVTTVPPEIRELEKKLEEVVKEKEAAIRGQEFEKAARLRDKEKELRAPAQRAQEDLDRRPSATQDVAGGRAS